MTRPRVEVETSVNSVGSDLVLGGAHIHSPPCHAVKIRPQLGCFSNLVSGPGSQAVTMWPVSPLALASDDRACVETSVIILSCRSNDAYLKS